MVTSQKIHKWELNWNSAHPMLENKLGSLNLEGYKIKAVIITAYDKQITHSKDTATVATKALIITDVVYSEMPTVEGMF